MVAWTLADAINEKYGGDTMAEKIKCLKISS